jgi:hypothetical protein
MAEFRLRRTTQRNAVAAFRVDAAGCSTKRYDRNVGTVNYGRSGCGVFDDAGVAQQLSKFLLAAISRLKVGYMMDPSENFGPTRGAPCCGRVPLAHRFSSSYYQPFESR